MADPIGIGPAVKEAGQSVQSIMKLYDVSERVAAKILLSGFEDFAAPLGAAAETEVVPIAEAASEIAGFVVILIVLACLVMLEALKVVLVTIFKGKLFGIGDRIAGLVQIIFSPLDFILAALGQQAADLVLTLVHAFVQVTGWGARQSGLTEVPPFVVTGPVVPQTFLDEFNTTQAEIKHINQQISYLYYALGQEQNLTKVPPQVWSEIHALQRQTAALGQTQLHILAQIDALADGMTSLNHQFATLSSELHGIRAIQVGVTDLQEQITTLGTLVAQLADETARDLHVQGRQIAQLSPLGLLLQPGIKGLRTLRQLEDTPCMCPKFLSVPNELGTALALMEFVENG